MRGRKPDTGTHTAPVHPIPVPPLSFSLQKEKQAEELMEIGEEQGRAVLVEWDSSYPMGAVLIGTQPGAEFGEGLRWLC